jgi:hypothetical protein
VDCPRTSHSGTVNDMRALKPMRTQTFLHPKPNQPCAQELFKSLLIDYVRKPARLWHDEEAPVRDRPDADFSSDIQVSRTGIFDP